MQDNDKRKNNEQYTYINGLGFFQKSPKQLERKSLIMQYNLILFAMLILFFLRSIILLPIIRLLWLFNFNIDINPMTHMITLSPSAEQLAKALSFVVYMAIPIFIISFFSRHHVSLKKIFAVPNRNTITIGVCVMIGVSIVANSLMFAFNSSINLGGIYIIKNSENHPKNTVAFIIFILFSTLISAFFEELLFRGAILSVLRRFGDMVAIVVSTILFSLFAQSLDCMIYSFILGLGLGYFAVKSGSVIVPILASFVIKSIALLTQILSQTKFASEPSNMYVIQVFLIILSLVFFIKFVVTDKNAFQIYMKETNLTNRTKIKLAFTNVGFWLLLILSLLGITSTFQIIG